MGFNGESANCPYGKKSIWWIVLWENVCIESIHLQNNCYYSFSEGTCTEDHPFAYLNGQYCCETNQELVNGGTPNEIASGACDGIGFSIESTCCKENKFLKCPHTKCKDHAGKVYEKFDYCIAIIPFVNNASLQYGNSVIVILPLSQNSNCYSSLCHFQHDSILNATV